MDHTDEQLDRLARRVGQGLLAKGWRLASAESCTGGWIAKTLTDIAGSSGWFGWGFVTYADEAKTTMLDVPAALIEAHGAVSEPVVRAMAASALERSGADIAVAVSGIAGPDGGSAAKPVGTVWIAWSSPSGTRAVHRLFAGNREAVRRASVADALDGVLGELGDGPG